jgi:hypothetical protein
MAFVENNPGIATFDKDGDSIEGVLIKVQDNVGPQQSMLYTLEANGEVTSVWGSTVLDQRMVGVKIGDLIRIVYKGLGEASPGKNPPKIFQVLIDRPESKSIPEQNIKVD